MARRRTPNGKTKSSALKAAVAFKQVEAGQRAKRAQTTVRSTAPKGAPQVEVKKEAPVTTPKQEPRISAEALQNAEQQVIKQAEQKAQENQNTTQQQSQADDKDVNVGAGQGQQSEEKDLNISADQRIANIERALNSDVLTAEQRSALEDELKGLKAAKAGTKTDENDKPEEEKKGEKFTKGDIIDYLYDNFLQFVSWGFDNLDAFLLGSAEMGGQFIGDCLKDVFGKNAKLAARYKELSPVRDFRNTTEAIDNVYNKEVKYYQKTRDARIDLLNDAAVCATMLADGFSLADLDAKYAALKGAKNLSASDKRALKLLESLVPGQEDKDGMYLTQGQREAELKRNMHKLAERFGPSVAAAALPHEGERQAQFKERVHSKSLNEISTTMDNCITYCNMQQQAAYTVKLQTLADCSRYNGYELDTDDKIAAITNSYLNNSREIAGEVHANFGNPLAKGMSEEDMDRYTAYLEQKNLLSTDINKKNAQYLGQHHNLDGRKEELKHDLDLLYSIRIGKPAEDNGKTNASTKSSKKQGLEGFADEYNTQTPAEQMYARASAKVDANIQEKERNEKRRQEKENKVGKGKSSSEKVVEKFSQRNR